MSSEIPKIVEEENRNERKCKSASEYSADNIEMNKVSEEMKEPAEIFKDQVGNHLMSARWALRSGERENVDQAKENFYAALDQFRSAGYESSEKINEQSLAEFEKFKNVDWKDMAHLQKIVAYFKSVAY